MANHKSAIKRIRTSEKKRVHNRYYARSMRNMIRNFRALTEKKEAGETLPKVVSLIDKNTKRGIIHKNKASNLKSKLTRQVNTL
ncbi:MAG: 30S ribosomal protein S20 [Bacteroidetes bacterium]|nr:MAG: 30S ribosomal protein S20 [Bacteroidota bacterium]